MKFCGFQFLKQSFSIMFYDKSKNIIKNYFIQMTLKEPFLFPHKEERFNNGSWIFGWLFFYFGNIIADGSKGE